MSQDIESIPALLNECRTIAVIGLSANADRPSNEVAAYMQAQGYRIIPVNPTYAGIRILNEHCYATLKQAAEALSEEGGKIQMVNCFRKSEYMMEIADEAIMIGARCIWMQLGIVHEAAAAKARQAGLAVIMNKCVKIEHSRYAR